MNTQQTMMAPGNSFIPNSCSGDLEHVPSPGQNSQIIQQVIEVNGQDNPQQPEQSKSRSRYVFSRRASNKADTTTKPQQQFTAAIAQPLEEIGPEEQFTPQTEDQTPKPFSIKLSMTEVAPDAPKVGAQDFSDYDDFVTHGGTNGYNYQEQQQERASTPGGTYQQSQRRAQSRLRKNKSRQGILEQFSNSQQQQFFNQDDQNDYNDAIVVQNGQDFEEFQQNDELQQQQTFGYQQLNNQDYDINFNYQGSDKQQEDFQDSPDNSQQSNKMPVIKRHGQSSRLHESHFQQITQIIQTTAHDLQNSPNEVMGNSQQQLRAIGSSSRQRLSASRQREREYQQQQMNLIEDSPDAHYQYQSAATQQQVQWVGQQQSQDQTYHPRDTIVRPQEETNGQNYRELNNRTPLHQQSPYTNNNGANYLNRKQQMQTQQQQFVPINNNVFQSPLQKKGGNLLTSPVKVPHQLQQQQNINTSMNVSPYAMSDFQSAAIQENVVSDFSQSPNQYIQQQQNNNNYNQMVDNSPMQQKGFFHQRFKHPGAGMQQQQQFQSPEPHGYNSTNGNGFQSPSQTNQTLIPVLHNVNPQSFQCSPDMVPNKAQKLEERYLQRSQTKLDNFQQPLPVGPSQAIQDLRKSQIGASLQTNFDQFVPKASIPEIQQRFLNNFESIKQQRPPSAKNLPPRKLNQTINSNGVQQLRLNSNLMNNHNGGLQTIQNDENEEPMVQIVPQHQVLVRQPSQQFTNQMILPSPSPSPKNGQVNKDFIVRKSRLGQLQQSNGFIQKVRQQVQQPLMQPNNFQEQQVDKEIHLPTSSPTNGHSPSKFELNKLDDKRNRDAIYEMNGILSKGDSLGRSPPPLTATYKNQSGGSISRSLQKKRLLMGQQSTNILQQNQENWAQPPSCEQDQTQQEIAEFKFHIPLNEDQELPSCQEFQSPQAPSAQNNLVNFHQENSSPDIVQRKMAMKAVPKLKKDQIVFNINKHLAAQQQHAPAPFSEQPMSQINIQRVTYQNNAQKMQPQMMKQDAVPQMVASQDHQENMAPFIR